VEGCPKIQNAGYEKNTQAGVRYHIPNTHPQEVHPGVCLGKKIQHYMVLASVRLPRLNNKCKQINLTSESNTMNVTSYTTHIITQNNFVD